MLTACRLLGRLLVLGLLLVVAVLHEHLVEGQFVALLLLLNHWVGVRDHLLIVLVVGMHLAILSQSWMVFYYLIDYRSC